MLRRTVNELCGQQWYNDTLRSLKREKPRAERKWLKKKNDENAENYRRRKNVFYEALRSTKSEYYKSVKNVNKEDPKALCGVVRKLSGDKESRKLPDSSFDEKLADALAVFFNEKIWSIREEINSE